MAKKCNLYRLLRHFIPRNDEFDEPYIENSFATITGCDLVANIKMRQRLLAIARKSNHPDRSRDTILVSRASGSASAKGGPAGQAVANRETR
jgi:hypothetical protein